MFLMKAEFMHELLGIVQADKVKEEEEATKIASIMQVRRQLIIPHEVI